MFAWFTIQVLLFLNLYAVVKNDPPFRPDYIWASAHKSYYRIHDLATNWEYARHACETEGTALAVPESIPELENLKTLISNMKAHFTAIYIGIHDLFSQGAYVTIKGEPIANTILNLFWAEDQPDNENRTGSCVVMTRDALLHDVPCDDRYPFLCKIKYEDVKHNEHCGNFDTGYIPNDNGKCYKLHDEPLTWQDAYLTCRAEQGHLAIMNSQEEANLVTSFLGEHLSNNAPDPNILFLGYSDLLYPFQYRTIFGETLMQVGYDSWSPVKDDPSKIYEKRCGCISRTGFLQVSWCDIPAMFLCQRHINKSHVV